MQKQEHTIDLGMGIEEMPYVTLGYSATILMLNLIALEMALLQAKITETTYQSEIAELQKSPLIYQKLSHNQKNGLKPILMN